MRRTMVDWFGCCALVAGSLCAAQEPAAAPGLSSSAPIAIVPIDNPNGGQAAKVTGALEVAEGKAVIVASGSVTSGSRTTEVVLPRRGVLRVCASTTVKLAADASVPAGETPGLMLALDQGAVEMSFAASVARGRNADILLTPDFRILIGGPGAAEVMVRLGQRGDTCVDNHGATAPYVLVTSVFDGSNYRVQPGQRVMFQHGSTREVVDQEKEPCGCPPAKVAGNEFPLAQSEGLAPAPKPAPPAVQQGTGKESGETLVYNGAEHAPPAAAKDVSAEQKPPAPPPAPPKKKKGFFSGIGHFFRKLFGAEE
ncbi:MAG: hypothetical protein WCE75_01830 [Terracidiphilus sp.]